MKFISKKLLMVHDSGFLRQITVSFIVGILTLIIVATIAISWFASNRTERFLIKQGHQITENFARQSMLALLYGEGANAKDAANGALAFPDVLTVYLYDASLKLILHEGDTLNPTVLVIPKPVGASVLIAENKQYWRFRAPVFSHSEHDDEFVVQQSNTEPELLGYADVVLSKRTLFQTIASNFYVNSVIFVALATILLIVMRVIAKRITKPLNKLSASMYKYDTEQGFEDVYAEENGPKEIRLMAHAFNQMLSAIKERDTELRNQNSTLEMRVNERTIELAEARDAAIEANITKSRFLANMSHELRTPLNAIIGYSEMLMEDMVGRNNDTIYSDLQKVNTAGVHLLGLISDILDISKIEAGKMELYLHEFSIDTMLTSVRTVIEPLAKKNNNKLHISCPEGVGSMLSDEQKIYQCLLNLLSNACKFTKNGEISLVIRSLEMQGAELISFCVTDQGIGMTQHQVNNLFVEFAQADSSTTREYGGTGLGLAISHRFCEMIGGDISVSSVKNEGTVFTMLLPKVLTENAAVSTTIKISDTIKKPEIQLQ
ncbi:MAG: HAMP domain-containing protein [Ectothiorhodospiraceae bacterium]|nr:HAMP domain-containing protein [Ectothiorhodospiraceae bacterium]